MKFSISAFCWIPLVAITSYCAYEQQIYGRRAQRDITLVLLISVVLRLTWFALQDVHYLGLRVLNRLSVMFQCMGVLMLLFIWMKSMTADEVLFWKCRNIAICGFAVLWVFVFVTTFLSKKIWYQVNVLTVGWVSFMIALLALCYGLVVNYKMRLIKDDAYLISSEYPQRKKIARRLILVSVVVSLCFGLRTVLFGLANEFLSDVYFPWFVYYVSILLFDKMNAFSKHVPVSRF